MKNQEKKGKTNINKENGREAVESFLFGLVDFLCAGSLPFPC